MRMNGDHYRELRWHWLNQPCQKSRYQSSHKDHGRVAWHWLIVVIDVASEQHVSVVRVAHYRECALVLSVCHHFAWDGRLPVCHFPQSV